jgi:hypothetical protein
MCDPDEPGIDRVCSNFEDEVHDAEREVEWLKAEIAKKKAESSTGGAQSTCVGCRESQPNQLAHMEPGGCLHVEE